MSESAAAVPSALDAAKYRTEVEQTIRDYRDVGRRIDARRLLEEHPVWARSQSLVVDLAVEEYLQQLEYGKALDHHQHAEKFPDVQDAVLGTIKWFKVVEGEALKKRQSWPLEWENWLGFELVEFLGRGAFSQVYLARDKAVGNRPVVVKANRLGRNEAALLGQVRHPHVVEVFSVKTDAELGLTAVCLPFLGRTTLEDLVLYTTKHRLPETAAEVYGILDKKRRPDDPQTNQPLPWSPETPYVDCLLETLEKLASALEVVHDLGILHQDIKPSNILLTAECQPRLFDFNLSVDNTSRTTRGGTLPFMAPEQLRAMANPRTAPPVDGRADLFSLAASFYQLLSGQIPFQVNDDPRSISMLAGDRALEQLTHQQKRPIPLNQLNPAVDEGLAALIDKCLAFDPADRVQNAFQLCGHVQRVRASRRRARLWEKYRKPVFAALMGTTAVGIVAVALAAPAPRTADEAFRQLDDLKQKGQYTTSVLSEQELRGLRDWRLWALEADLLATTGSFNTAIRYYRSALAEKPDDPILLSNLAFCLAKDRGDEEARVRLNEALEIHPGLKSAWHQLVRLESLVPIGKCPDLEVIDRHRDFPDSGARAFYNVAMAYAKAANCESGPEREARFDKSLAALKTSVEQGSGPQWVESLQKEGRFPDSYSGQFAELRERAAKNHGEPAAPPLLLDSLETPRPILPDRRARPRRPQDEDDQP